MSLVRLGNVFRLQRAHECFRINPVWERNVDTRNDEIVDIGLGCIPARLCGGQLAYSSQDRCHVDRLTGRDSVSSGTLP